jgi:hypothetical protein
VVAPASSAFFAAMGIGRRERARRFHRVARDLWVPGDIPDERELLRTLFAVAPDGSALSHETAVRWYGLPADRRADGHPPHITVPVGTNFDRKEFTVHIARLPSDDLATFDGGQLTTPPRTYLDIASAMDRERLVVVGDAMLGAQLTTTEALEDRIARARGIRGVRLARTSIPLLDGRAQSPPESIIRLRFHNAGIPRPELQYAVRIGAVVLHPDMAWPQALVALEYEGRQHTEHDQFMHDIDRYSAFSALGWLVIRAGARDLAGRSAALISRVAATLRRRGMRW